MNKAFHHIKTLLVEEFLHPYEGGVERALSKGNLKEYIKEYITKVGGIGYRTYNNTKEMPLNPNKQYTSALFHVLDHPAITADHISDLYTNAPHDIVKEVSGGKPNLLEEPEYEDSLLYLHSLQHPKVAKAGHAGPSAVLSDLVEGTPLLSVGGPTHVRLRGLDRHAPSGTFLNPLAHLAMNPGQSPEAMKHNLNALFGFARVDQDDNLHQSISRNKSIWDGVGESRSDVFSDYQNSQSKGERIARFGPHPVSRIHEWRIVNHLLNSPSMTMNLLGNIAQQKLIRTHANEKHFHETNITTPDEMKEFLKSVPEEYTLDMDSWNKTVGSRISQEKNRTVFFGKPSGAFIPRPFFRGSIPTTVELDKADGFESSPLTEHEGKMPTQFTDEEVQNALNRSSKIIRGLYGEEGFKKIMETQPWRR